MSKFLKILICAALACSAWAQDAYVKGGSFADTVEKSAAKYRAAAEKRAADFAKDFKISDAYASFAFPNWSKHEIDSVNPAKNPFNSKLAFDGEYVWKKIGLCFDRSFDLQICNPRYKRDVVFYVYFTIDAARAATLPLEISSGGKCELFVNADSVALLDSSDASEKGYLGRANVSPKNSDRRTSGFKKVALNLKKGENKITLKYFVPTPKLPVLLYMSFDGGEAVATAEKIAADFPSESDTFFRWGANRQVLPSLLAARDNRSVLKDYLSEALERSLYSAGRFERELEKLSSDGSEAGDAARIALWESMLKTLEVEKALGYDVANVRAAMEDIKKTYPEYDGDFAKLAEWEKAMPEIRAALAAGDASAKARAAQFKQFATKSLLANPLLKKHPKWAFIFRKWGTKGMGIPQNWQGNTALVNAGFLKGRAKSHTFADELWIIDDISNPQKARKVFEPKSAIADIDVSYDGKKILYSTIDDKICWRLDEIDLESGKTRRVSPRLYDDIDAYDGAYTPDGKIIFCSTATHVGVPCVEGDDWVANLYSMDANAATEKEAEDSIRQLTFEQDADWSPTMLENGRVLYTRWEYTDNSHYFSRILMHMNPDGTAQSAFYGSTSYWPNSLFYCRQIPNDPNKFVGIVSGHHGVARVGELHLFDVSKGTVEEKGQVHKYASFGKTFKPEIKDRLVDDKFPKIIHPYPLSENYIIASVFGFGDEPQGICLIDKFDNITLLHSIQSRGYVYEPVPVEPRKLPNEIVDKTDPDLDYGYVFLNDIYKGDGLKGVPRGTVKALRIFEYFYCYRDIGGHAYIGNEGSWDVKRILGTVPVEPDGSALFKAPANRPIAVQPLDADGKALALMRSWFVVMPNETQSCVGCHEGQGMTPTTAPAAAARKRPENIREFLAPVRGYSFDRDVQPVLDQYCAGCHNPDASKNIPNFSRKNPKIWRKFSESYLNLTKYVRRSGPESNQHMLAPLEFHADTSELMQMLEKGHKGVKLDADSKAALITWIDLNVPFFGTWKEVYPTVKYDGYERRKFFLAKYANRHDDPNEIKYDGGERKFQRPAPAPRHRASAPKADGFPFGKAEAARKVADAKLPKEIVVPMGGGVNMRFTLVPAGSFVFGSNGGFYDEGPARLEKVEKPFYMSQMEVSNAQYATIDPTHDSGHQDRLWKDHVNQGYPSNLPEQSVVRVSWNEAADFCKKLSEKIGVGVSLPTEVQWEWAARGGSGEDFWFGKLGDDFGNFENLMDFNAKKLAVDGIDPQPRIKPSEYYDTIVADRNVDDGNLMAVQSGMYAPNPFGLYDMQGNVAEWTLDDYTKTLGGEAVPDRKVVRGGSWRDRMKFARVSLRRPYRPWQKVYNVGMRLVINDAEKAAKLFPAADALPEYKFKNTKPLPLNLSTAQ